jgi:hypothetical protein
MLGDIERLAFDALYSVPKIADPAAAIAAWLSILGYRTSAILRKGREGDGRDNTDRENQFRE